MRILICDECRMTLSHLPAIKRGDLVCWFESNKTHVCLLNLVLSQRWLIAIVVSFQPDATVSF